MQFLDPKEVHVFDGINTQLVELANKKERTQLPIKEPPGNAQTVSGTVRRIVFNNPENGFNILRVIPEKEKSETTVVGIGLGSIEAGTHITAYGKWVNDPKFGKQFKAESIQSRLPSQPQAIERYLSSGIFKGVGNVLAARLVKEFGSQVFEVLEKDPQQLAQVQGLNKNVIDNMVNSWDSQKAESQVTIFLHEFGLSKSVIRRIIKRYGFNTFNAIKHNPYILIDNIWGVGFTTADEIAQKVGINKQDAKRVRAGLIYTLQQAAQNGSCGSYLDDLLTDTVLLLAIPRDVILLEVRSEIQKGQLVIEDHAGMKAVFLQYYYELENLVALRISKKSQKTVPWGTYNFQEIFEGIERTSNITFSAQQRKAIKAAFTNNVTIITGGPGVGKTTIINAVLKIFNSLSLEVKLCAPTGTAAKKMGLATGHHASTIHSLLGIDPVRQEMRFSEKNPLECDLVVVDEVSMIDIELMATLLKAIGPSTAILFVGDKDQLPSIGPGNVLKDIIQSQSVEVVFLTEIYRQAQGSRIITVARQILEGKIPDLRSDPDNDFFFIEANDPQKCQDYVSLMVTERIPRKFGLNPLRDIQVLAPMKNGLVGINTLNEVLQAKLNPDSSQKVLHGSRSFTKGDKVIQNRNDYDKEIFNGDIGYIFSIESENRRLEVDFDGRLVEYEFEELDSLDPAFAITIHKSQGSEYPAVVIPLMLQHRIMLQRKLIYTGITRGKGLVIVIGQAEAFSKAIRNARFGRKTTERVTRLNQLLLTH